MNSAFTVERASDEATEEVPERATISGTYIPHRFESRYKNKGHRYTSRSPTLWQAGVWQPPKNAHVFPASSRRYISLPPRVSCASITHGSRSVSFQHWLSSRQQMHEHLASREHTLGVGIEGVTDAHR